MRTPTELTATFRSRGLKNTPQRQAVFAYLYGNESHPTAETVYEAIVADMPSISLRTVYQTLNDLVSLGELVTVGRDGGAVRFDPNTAQHHHTACDRCGALADIDLAVPALVGDLAGFRAHSTHIVVRGHCAPCAAASPLSSNEKENHYARS